MSNLLLNFVLALIWTFVTGAFTLGNFAVGFVLGYAVMRLARPLIGASTYDAQLWHQIMLLGFFMRELFISSVRVAWEVLTPGYSMRAGVMAIPLDVETDLEITMLANLISLTPGTLSIDVSADRKKLFVHNMYLDDSVEASILEIKHELEQRIMRATGSYKTSKPGPKKPARLTMET